MKKGEFEFQLGENKIVLRCTPSALRYIETKHGGIRNIINKLYQIEFVTAVDIIEAGLLGGKEHSKELLENEVFDFGVINLIPLLTDYINMLYNGGELPKEEDEGVSKKGEA